MKIKALLKIMPIAVISFVSGTSHAVLIEAELPSSVYISVGTFDWAWASSVAPGTDMPPNTFDISIQSLFGWRVAETADFLRDGVDASSFGVEDNFACAAAYFSGATDCNYGDGQLRAVHNMPNPYGGGHEYVWETWVVRGAGEGPVPVPVPAPATLALFGLGLAGLGWSRRKKRNHQA